MCLKEDIYFTRRLFLNFMDSFKRTEFYNRIKFSIFLYVAIQTIYFLLVLMIGTTSIKFQLSFILINVLTAISFLFILGKRKNKGIENECNFLSNSLLTTKKIQTSFKNSLNEETAHLIAVIVKDMSNFPAVAITDKEKVLAFVGMDCQQHSVGESIRTKATYEVFKPANTKFIYGKKEFGCMEMDCNCPYESVIIIPLFLKSEVLGSINFYRTKKGKMSDEALNLASGIGKLINMQIEIAELERQTQLASKAKFDALQAQVNPHFLFNSLNTIKMYTYKDADFARKLIVKLASQLRYQLDSNSSIVSLEKELSYIDDYVTIINARFKDKLTVEYDIEDKLKNTSIPVLSIYPLVHNSVVHGILPAKSDGCINISARLDDKDILITVTDNGKGIAAEDMDDIFKTGYGSGCGVGIPNLHERLLLLYGNDFTLNIESEVNKGTKAYFKVPYGKKGDSNDI